MFISYIDAYNKEKKELAATVLSSLAGFEIMVALLNNSLPAKYFLCIHKKKKKKRRI